MKKIKRLILVMLVISSGAVHAQTWSPLGTAGFSAGVAQWTSIAIDRSGIPYVVYNDGGNGYKATVMKYSAGSWVIVGTAGFSAGEAIYSSIAIDSSGTPYVVYEDYANGYGATVMKYNGSSWVTVGSAGFSAGGATYTSIAIDTGGTPYVVYEDSANSMEATVMKYNGSSWVVVGSAGFSATQAPYTNIAIDGSGTPYVVYSNNPIGGGGQAMVMKYNGSSWVTVGATGFAIGAAIYVSIAIDGSGTPYVVYTDVSSSSKATVMKYNGSNWVYVGSEGFSTGEVIYNSIAIDTSGTPYVVYEDLVNAGKATVMKYNGSGWVSVGIAGFSVAQAYYTSIAINRSGTPYVVYEDLGNSDKATVMELMMPAPFPITGIATVCMGATTTLSDITGGGTWSSGNTSIATVGSTGIVTGVAAGTDLISYTTTGGSATIIVTINGVLPQNWNTVGSVGFSAGGVQYTSIAINGSGTPYVVYQDGGNGFKATAMKYSAGSWVTVGSAGFSVGQAINTSIAIDTGGTPYVAYQDNANGGKATVMKYNGSSWVNVGSAGFSAAAAAFPSIAIDGNGTPYVAFSDNDYAFNPITVMKYNGSGWVIVGSAAFSAGNPQYPSIAIDATGTPYVAYEDGGNGDKTTVMKYNGSSWITVGSTGFSAGQVQYTSIAIDTGGTPYVVYQDGGNGDKSTVMKYNGSNWVTVGTAGFSADTVWCTSIAIDGSGTPYVVYADGTLSGGEYGPAMVQKYNGSSWTTVGNADFSAGGAGNTSIAINGGGTPYVAYMDIAHSEKATVMKLGATPITGITTVCAGSTTALSDATTGGTWSSSTTSVANVSSAGVVTGVSSGSATISYTLSNSCGSAVATTTVTVFPLPATITGTFSVCVTGTTSLSDVTGGTWSTSNTNATTDGSGNITGVTAGTSVITYTSVTGCQTTAVVTVTSTSAGSITGTATVCASSSITLSDVITSGIWSSGSTSIATVGSTGIINGISGGTATISYSIANSCGTATAIQIVTVNPLPIAGTITGTLSVCSGSTTPLSDATTGGIWSCASTGIATIGSTGITTGVSSGTAIISYAVTNSCGTSTATKIVTVNPLPSAGTIIGIASVCVSSTINLSDATTGGTWTSSNNAVGTVSSIGNVSGVSAATVTVSYSVTNSCGTAVVTKIITVNPLPIAGTIIGASTVCVTSTMTLSNLSSGGTWSSSITGVATIGSTGIVTGASSGTTTISYMVTNSCGNAIAYKVVTVNPLPSAGTINGLSTVCAGSNITLSDATLSGIWSSSSTGIATIGSTGIITGVATGTTTISYAVTNSCGTATVTTTVTVNPLPFAGIVTGLSSVCFGSIITLSDATTGGTWSSSNTAQATVGTTGIVTAVSGGTATISYTVNNTCGSASATQTITINPLPSAGTITGATIVCTGVTITLTNAATGGIWGSTNGNTSVSGEGIVTGISAGTDTIEYIIITSCGTASASKAITVNTSPSAGTISGLTSVCSGTNIALSDAITGGTWSSYSTGIAAVGTSGVVTGVAAGTTLISYAVTNTCGTSYVTQNITVNPLANAGTITGLSSVCAESNITLTDVTYGGAWTASNTNADVTSTGVVYGLTAGSDIISYTVTNTCGSATATKTVTINALPSSGIITGFSSVCVGANITLSDAITGGTWTSSLTSVATIGTTGSVTGLLNGTTTISYGITNTCGTSYSTQNITVNPLPNAGTISGTTTVCAGSTTSLTDATTGGTWSAYNSNVTVTSAGLVSGIISGTDTIYYTTYNVCGYASINKTVTINPLPNAGSITGSTTVCPGNSITLSDTESGGTWSSSAPGVATVGTSGSVTGVSAGTTTISYSVTNTCGTAYSTQLITVNPSANAGTITGLSTVCTGANTTLTDAAAGGLWTSSNANAFVIGGTVYGVTAGTDIISYTVTNPCGSATATYTVTINPTPTVGAISGSSSVCAGSSITLSDASAGGSWISSNTSVATVGVSGSVTGVSAGTSTISYTIANGCGAATATQVVSVNPLPSAGTITGAASVCLGGSITLSDAVAGGSWSASNSNALVTSTGLVYGMASGSDIISYTVANGCGSATTTLVVSINVAPSGGGIFGASAVCIGSSTTLSVLGASGGTWSVGNANATVSAGVVTGVSAGIDSVYYTVTNGCGTGVARYAITVETSPYVAPLNGASYVCVGSVIVITDSIAGGYWSTSSSNVTPLGGGSFRGTSPGLVNIIYNVTNSCGTATANKIITVIALPSAGTITGASGVCIGSTATVTDAATGGIWSTTNSNAVISGYGLISGLTAGLDTIVYTNINVCGVATTSRTVTVNAVANAGTIAGLSSACVGNTVTLSDAAAGGIWSSSNTGVATVGTAGAVSAVAAGSATISYSVTNSCGTVTAILPFTVNPLPIAGSVTGASVVCTGSNAALTDAAAGGVWYASNSNAIVSSAGLVYGLTAGVDTISYAVTNSCGTATATSVITINPLPAAGTITGLSSVCPGANITLTDGAPGGTWSATNGNASVVAGLVTGVTAGLDTVVYTVTNGCGTTTASRVITINNTTLAGTITGASTVCNGGNTTLSDAVAGGVWSATNGNAIITASGVVYAMSIGVDTIIYNVTGACGSATATTVITINPLPSAGSISGSSSVCAGSTITLSNTTTGGTWSSSNTSVATIGSSGIVSAIISGIDTIKYTKTNSCGSATAIHLVTINPLPNAGTITGSDTVCRGNSILLSDTVTDGLWTSTNGNSFVSTDGAVYGITIGIDTIKYAVTNSCGTVTAQKILHIINCSTEVNNITEPSDIITLYPNPTQNNITISSTRKINTVVITNLLGQNIFSREYDTKEVVISLNHLSSGMYVVKINDSKVYKVVKQ